jgi:hypothetical protein
MIPVSDRSSQEIRFRCPNCPGNGRPLLIGQDRLSNDRNRPSEEPHQRFRRLLESAEESKNSSLPDWLIEELPAEARRLLQADKKHVRPSIGPQLSNDLAQALRDQGYVIDEDARGLRITGHLSTRSQDPGKMSPYDVLRMAADLDGGIQKPGERKRCPKCDAVLPKEHTTCDWCGTSIE